MRTAFITTLTGIARKDPSVMLLTGDLGFTVFEGFAKEFPDRFLNMGVAEQNMIGVAAGLALSGRRVFAYSIIPFLTLRCLEHIRNDLCHHRTSVCLVGMGGGYAYGHMGPSHHALEDIAAMRSLPGMRVLCPGDTVETAAAVHAAAEHDGPCYLRLGKSGEQAVHDASAPPAIGRTTLLSPGKDLTLLATGTMLATAIETAALLRTHGIAAGVVSVPQVQPLDCDGIRALALQAPLLVTLEEHRLAGGFGSAVAETLAPLRQRPPHLICCAPDEVSHLCGSREWLLQQAGLTPASITDTILRLLRA